MKSPLLMKMRSKITGCLFALAGVVLAFYALLWVFIASGEDAEALNAYFAAIDEELIRDAFAAEGVQYIDAQGWNTGAYSSITLYVDKECRLPEAVIDYMENHQLGWVMWVELVHGHPGTSKVLEKKVFF